MTPSEKILSLTQALIRENSVTPDNSQCQNILAARLGAMGFSIRHLEIQGVKNLWAIRGQTRPLLVFAGHSDVVPAGPLAQWDSPPFEPSIRDGKLYGRGVADMKGALAAMVIACEQFLQEHPEHPGSLGFLITGDEEGPAQYGTKAVMEMLHQEGITIDACLIGEPSSDQTLADTLKIGRRGSLNGHFQVLGTQGHIAYPHRANNPIPKALQALHQLCQNTWDPKPNPYFPPTSFQISNLQAGTGATNVIPAELKGSFNFRFSTELSPEALQQQVQQAFQDAACPVNIDWQLSGLPFLCSSGPLLTATQQAIQTTLGQHPKLSTDGGTSDGRFIAPYGVEVLELGLCNHSIHAVNEHASLENLSQLSKLYQKILHLIF